MTERMQTIPVKEFLENMGLMQYFDMFIIKGFDHEKDIVTLDEDDLDAMLISDPDHRHQILQAGEYELSPMSSLWTKFTSSLLKYNVCVGLAAPHSNLTIIDGEGCFLIVLTDGQSRKILTKYTCIGKCVCACINTVKWLYSACMI